MAALVAGFFLMLAKVSVSASNSKAKVPRTSTLARLATRSVLMPLTIINEPRKNETVA
ncbi:hypothetical protein D3C81_1815340 [compost metagenome]